MATQNVETMWNSVGKIIPKVPIQTQDYNKVFVTAMIGVGFLSACKLTYLGIKKAYSAYTKEKPLSPEQFQQRYGKNTWALIANVSQNEQICLYLAKMGLNLILMGDPQDTKIVRNMIDFETPSCQTKQLKIHWDWNWNKIMTQYQKLLKQVEGYDISFLVLPRPPESIPSNENSHQGPVFLFQNYIYLLRHIGPLLRKKEAKYRRSAVIFVRSPLVYKIVKGSGITHGLTTCLDAMLQNFEYENRDKIDVICSGGNVSACFTYLGKKTTSQ